MTVWYLEQSRSDQKTDLGRPVPDSGPVLAIERLFEPELPYYRWLFNLVGQPWNWYSRNQLSDPALAEIIHDPRVEVLQLLRSGRLVGFAELDRRQDPEVELKFFGLIPTWTGCGLGGPMLSMILNRAWSTQTSRVWLHTCSDDHPAALKLYLSAGFRIFDQQH